MKNNIIKDDREITMKTASLPTDMSDDTESIATVGVASPLENNNLSTQACEMNTQTPTDIPEPTEPLEVAEEPTADPVVAWQSTQAEVTASFEHGMSAITKFFDNNRQLLITGCWIFLAIISAKFIFTALGTIDDIPLVTPILKIVGLVSVVRFTWRYLIREHDRQELIEMIDRTKVEVLGDRPMS